MTAITENDLKKLEDLIIQRFSAIESRLTVIENTVIDLKIGQAKLVEKVEGLDKRLDDTNKRIDDLNGRLNTMTLGFLSIVGILVTGILGIIGKVVFFPTH